MIAKALEIRDYIIEHWHELKDGDVVDVEFILGETAVKKSSERYEGVGQI